MKCATILVPVDFSDICTRVVDHARDLAKLFGSRLVLLHVTQPEPDFVGYEAGPAVVRATTAEEIRNERHQLEDYKARLVAEGLDVRAVHIQGSLAEKVLAEAAQFQADLIVLGSHGHGVLYNLLVGSTLVDVVKGAPCPVLVIPAAQH